MVVVVHLADGRRFVADVGLGDGPGRPFECVPHTWEENGFRFALEDRGEGVWHFTHDPLGSFQGFDFNLSSSAVESREFAPYHAFYWMHPKSNYRTSGLVLQRMSPAHGIITLRSCTLKCIHPSLPGGSEVWATATTDAEWFAIANEHFSLPLTDMSAQERAALWHVAKRKHDEWIAEGGRAGKQKATS